jgi:hypothetical protein
MESKKHDLRDDIKAKTTVTDTDSRMAGGDDRPETVKPHSDMHATAPDPGSRNLAEGQVTKSN